MARLSFIITARVIIPARGVITSAPFPLFLFIYLSRAREYRERWAGWVKYRKQCGNVFTHRTVLYLFTHRTVLYLSYRTPP